MSIHDLQAALRAMDEAREKRAALARLGQSEDIHGSYAEARTAYENARLAVTFAKVAFEQAARRVAEGAGEPVAWLFWHRSDPDASLASVTRVKENADHLSKHGYIVQPLYTTPPSSDALVEALERLMRAKGFAEIDMAKQAAEQAIAKHKENTDVR